MNSRATKQSAPKHEEPFLGNDSWAKVTVALLDRQVAFLDQLAIDIRLKHRKAISRAEIIRAVVESAIQSGVDLSDSYSSESIVEQVNSARSRKR